MDEKKIQSTMGRATKWSAITEIMAKLVTPLSSMVLARFVSPAAFGVIAVVTMVLSFAEIFADAGFQKYLVQHEFKDTEEKYQSANVAFWTNFIMSALLLFFIVMFRNPIAELVGSPTSGFPIAIGSISLLLIAFSSIQMALYRREFDFKKLFTIRIFTILVPFVITIPLAIFGFSYWSIIIGTITTNLLNAILLTVYSKWKPKLFYKFKVFKAMFSFSFFTLLEAITIWLTTWADLFIIGQFFDEYHLGLYRNSNAMVNTIMSLITASIIPVLFAALSRMQNDEKVFNNTFFKVQKLTAMLVIPMGVGLFLFRNLATNIMLGDQWMDAAIIIGLNGLFSSLMIIFSHFNSEVFRAKGKPLLSTLTQVTHLLFLVPVCIIFSKRGFTELIYARTFIRAQLMVTSLLFMSLIIKFPVRKIFINIIPVFVATAIMAGVAYLLLLVSTAMWWQLVAILICIIVYACALLIFPSTRLILLTMCKKVYNKMMGLKIFKNKAKKQFVDKKLLETIIEDSEEQE